jgi:hypothetical protein
MNTLVTVDSCSVEFYDTSRSIFASSGISGFQLLQSRTPDGVMSVEITARAITAHGLLSFPGKPDVRPFAMIGTKGKGMCATRDVWGGVPFWWHNEWKCSVPLQLPDQCRPPKGRRLMSARS